MPKKIDAARSKMQSKSARKPLRDVSNAKVSVKYGNSLKKVPEDGERKGGDSLDRLLLVHSDISSILRQIDELVVQALQLKCDEGRKEIKKFADMLSGMKTSLEPWIPRFQKAISSGCNENKSEQSIDQTVLCEPKETTDSVIESPEESKWESLISPSPLVSWRAECNTKGGRQLFLLTPLPQTKMLSSKFKASSIPALENMKSDGTAQLITLFNSVGNAGTDEPESISEKPPANNVLDIEADKAVGTLDGICASPANPLKKGCSMFVMTPCLKMSPPKSCILLEPVSEFTKKKNPGAPKSVKSTPFPAAVQDSDSQDSESSSNQSSDDLKVKYPELYGINMNCFKNKKVVEDSPNWIVSPPKTCVIMEPNDEKLLKDPDIHAATDITESTPMIKEPVSNFRTGKQHPGENTLKKELWTKFEAASSHGIIRFDPSILHNSAKKGFLDRLEEAFDA